MVVLCVIFFSVGAFVFHIIKQNIPKEPSISLIDYNAYTYDSVQHLCLDPGDHYAPSEIWGNCVLFIGLHARGWSELLKVPNTPLSRKGATL